MASPNDDHGDTLPSFSLWHKIRMVPTLLALRESQHNHPLLTASRNVTAFAVAVGVFRENKGRSWPRAAHVATLRYLLGTPRNAFDLKIGFGTTTAEMYALWAKKSGAEVLTDNLPEGAALHWIGPRRRDRVFLFLHGAHISRLL